MADEVQELKYFNVKNITETRPVMMGALFFLPGEVKAVLDDAQGINRATVKADLWLDFTDEEPSEVQTELKKNVKEEKPAKTTKQTASGKGWNAQ